MKLVHVDDVRVVVGRTEDGWVAFEDRCTHRGGSLADGVMICGAVQCPWHGSQFDVRTGAVKAGPAEQSISIYEVEEVDGSVRLTITKREVGVAASK
jgi:nitrite reductase/ring-hydroxylating ferredoxin subunit